MSATQLELFSGSGRGSHSNSREGYAVLRRSGELQGRRMDCYRALLVLGRATDRQIKDFLRLGDMNAVRPRLTELRDMGLIREDGNVLDSLTGKTVRVLVPCK